MRVTGNSLASRTWPSETQTPVCAQKGDACWRETVVEIRTGNLSLGPVCICSKPLMSLMNIPVLWLVLYRKSWSLRHDPSSLLSVSVERICMKYLPDIIYAWKGLSLKENSKMLYFALQWIKRGIPTVHLFIHLVLFLFSTESHSLVQAGLEPISLCWSIPHGIHLSLTLSADNVCMGHQSWLQNWIQH